MPAIFENITLNQLKIKALTFRTVPIKNRIMNLRNNILLLFFFLLSVSLFSQESEYLETKAVIKNIEKKRSGKTVKEIATVEFTTAKGDNITTVVELERFPFLGSFKSIGDEITINYAIDNPAIASTNVGSFISKYGMYILIILGIIFSIRAYIKAKNKSYN